MAAGAWDAQLPVCGQVFSIWREQCSAQRSTWSVSFLPSQLDQPVSVFSLSLSLSESVSPLVVSPGSLPGDREDIGQNSHLSYF